MKYPQNYLIKNPLAAALILVLFYLISTAFFDPSMGTLSFRFSFSESMAIMSVSAALAALIFIWIVKSFSYFSNTEKWTFGKEILADLIIIAGILASLYIVYRIFNILIFKWFLIIMMIPFVFFTLVNIRFLFLGSSIKLKSRAKKKIGEGELVVIRHRRKKEEISFYPSQFIFAEAHGNYVKMHLTEEGKRVEKIIRNSLSNLEKQLSVIPSVLRTHRAYLVNLKKVISKHGNATGYRLRLKDVEEDIPVSRYHTAIFDRVYEQFSGQTSLFSSGFEQA